MFKNSPLRCLGPLPASVLGSAGQNAGGGRELCEGIEGWAHLPLDLQHVEGARAGLTTKRVDGGGRMAGWMQGWKTLGRRPAVHAHALGSRALQSPPPSPVRPQLTPASLCLAPSTRPCFYHKVSETAARHALIYDRAWAATCTHAMEPTHALTRVSRAWLSSKAGRERGSGIDTPHRGSGGSS